ncbi:MAG: hypothetical protein E7573_04850 [Ruminococcaceae bacterium]|nr:hypothetical protein [Oscillospiraceae bacterium]
MKNKLLYVFFAVTALICCLSFSAAAGFDMENDEILELDSVNSLDNCYSSGDANGDGTVSSDDARTILRVAVNLENIDASAFMKADIDEDGEITAQDARLALRLAVGLENIPGHNTIEIIIVPSTCTTEGLKVKVCTTCVKLYAKITTPADNHVPGVWETTQEANCLQEGIAQMKCLFCNTVIKETTIAKTGHSGEWTYPDGVNCLDAVPKHRTCTVCGNYEETVENPRGAHSFWWATEVPNTCTEDGLDVYKCKYCGEGSKSIVTKAHGHLYEKTVIITEPTCTETGLQGDKCVFCEDITNTKTLPALGHDYDNSHYKVTKEPSCSEEGTADVICTLCGDAREISLPVTEHDLIDKWEQTKAPDCTEEGLLEGVCRYCGPVTKAVSANGHTVAQWTNVRPATCTEEGLMIGYCSVCGNDAAEKVIEKKAHSFNEKDENGSLIIYHVSGVLCKEDGEGYIKCTVCGEKKYGKITCLGKCVMGEKKVYSEATCTQDAQTVEICRYCNEEIAGSIRTDYNTKLGHEWGTWTEIKQATCSERGERQQQCTRCEEVRSYYSPALAHTLGKWVTTKEATCTETGLKTLSCTVCETVLESEDIAMAAHKPGEIRIDKPATESEEGTCSIFCEICDKLIETKPFTRIFVEGTYEIEFADDCDVSAGGKVSFTVKEPAQNMFVRFAYTAANGEVIETDIELVDGVYTFTVPENIADTDVITIRIFGY